MDVSEYLLELLCRQMSYRSLTIDLEILLCWYGGSGVSLLDDSAHHECGIQQVLSDRVHSEAMAGRLGVGANWLYSYMYFVHQPAC